MTDFFSKWYATIQNRNKLFVKYRVYSLHRVFVRSLANFVLPIYYKLGQRNEANSLKPCSKDKDRVIVSLTSFPARIGRLWLVVESMFRQTHKPDMIILWLSKEQFPTLDSVPQTLLDQQSRGLCIELRDGDLRSHKKFYYAMSEFPDDNVVTIDDDVLYQSNLIEELYKNHVVHPDSIIANHIFSLVYDKDRNLLPYRRWVNEFENNSCHNVQIGVGGVLYPPNSLYSDTLNKDLFMDLAKLADDLWLFSMARLNNRKVIKTDFFPSFLPIQNRNNITLTSVNVGQNQNDIQIQNIRNYYIEKIGIDPFEFKSE